MHGRRLVHLLNRKCFMGGGGGGQTIRDSCVYIKEYYIGCE